MKLFRVTFYTDYENHDKGTHEALVIAKDSKTAEQIVEDNIWTQSGMEIKCSEEIPLDKEKLVCCVESEEFDYDEEDVC